MDDVPSSTIILFIFLLFLSAFFSSAETAFSSVNKLRLNHYAGEGRRGAKKALHIAENFDQTLTTLLVGNNLVNIAAATLSSQIAIQLYGPNLGVFISTFVVTFLVLIFGEIMPKSFAKEFAESYTLKTAGVLFLLVGLFKPITWLFIKLKNFVSVFFKNKEREPSVTEEEIKVLVQMSEDEGVIDEKERELVHRSLEFDDIIVDEIIKPRPDMVAVEVNDSVDEIKEVFFKERFSRIPVYEGNIDNIIGILSERDFLTEYIRRYDKMDIRSLLRDPLFVVQSMKISVLLPELQKKKVHMAIVIDEFGGTAGLITLEDILEEIVGEIWDEHDESVLLVRELSPGNYLFFADYPVDDFSDLLQLDLPETTKHTLGGWIIDELQRIPVEGEEIDLGAITLKILKVEENRIRQVHVTVNEVKTEEEETEQ